MLEVYPGSISLQRLDYLNSLTWMWYPTPSYSKVGVEKDIICIKMKKLMDLCYMSCKATIDSNDGEPLPGCICYTSDYQYIIDLFKVDHVYTITLSSNRISIDTSGTPLEGICFTKFKLTKEVYDRVDDLVCKTIDELENLRKQWKAI